MVREDEGGCDRAASTVREEEVQAYYEEHKARVRGSRSRARCGTSSSPPSSTPRATSCPGTPTQSDWDAAETEAAKVRSEIMNGANFVTRWRSTRTTSRASSNGGDLGDDRERADGPGLRAGGLRPAEGGDLAAGEDPLRLQHHPGARHHAGAAARLRLGQGADPQQALCREADRGLGEVAHRDPAEAGRGLPRWVRASRGGHRRMPSTSTTLRVCRRTTDRRRPGTETTTTVSQ